MAGSFAWSVDSDRFVCLLCLNVAHLCGMRFSIGLFVSAIFVSSVVMEKGAGVI